MPEWIQYYDAKYMGGQVEYPKPMHCRLFVYGDRLEIESPDLVIPYNTITNIENMDEKKISAKRVVALGLVFVPLAIVGAMWKKNHIYTVIQYKDGVGKKAIILDIGDKVDDIQGWIYRKTLSIGRSSIRTYSENEFMVYENRQYGFRIKYPKAWIMDELDQKNQNYVTVIEFRMSIESKPPFVTIYINNLPSNNMSFQDFINKEIEDIKRDSSTSIIESSDIVIANKPGVKLVDVEYEGYKRMVHWVSSNNMVFELSYTSEQAQYLKYLSVVDEIMNSFDFIEGTTVLTEALQTKNIDNQEEPLVILKRRFAKGEINEEEFQRMRSIIEA